MISSQNSSASTMFIASHELTDVHLLIICFIPNPEASRLVHSPSLGTMSHSWNICDSEGCIPNVVDIPLRAYAGIIYSNKLNNLLTDM